MIPAAILLILLVCVDVISHVALWASYFRMKREDGISELRKEVERLGRLVEQPTVSRRA